MDDHIQQLRHQSKMFWDAFQKAANEVVWLRQQNAELLEALQNIADGPRDVEKSYISLLHEVRYEARDAIAKATGGE